jgi:hypothetical protein
VIAALAVFTAAYATVMLLGLQSKLMRDNNWRLSFFTSWFITFAQTGSTYAIAHNALPIEWFLFFSGLGGSTGIVSAHFVYDWYDRKFRHDSTTASTCAQGPERQPARRD